MGIRFRYVPGLCQRWSGVAGKARKSFALGVAAYLWTAALPASGEDAADRYARMIATSTAYRVKNYSECYVVLDTNRLTGGDERRTVVEAWVKGDKIRNDVTAPSGKSYSIVDGNQYITMYNADSLPVIGATESFPDIWSHLGLVHPATIGACAKGVTVFAKGKHSWLLDDRAIERHARHLSTNDSGDTVRFTVDKESRVPATLTSTQRESLARTGKFLADEDADYKDVRIIIEAVFSKTFDGQLLSYNKLQEMNEGKSKSRSVLTNDYSKEPQSGLWYPSKSIYEVTHNERLIERVETVVQEINFSNVDDDIFTVDAVPLQEGTVVRNMVPGVGPTRGSVVNGKVEFPALRERAVALPFDPAEKSGRGRFLIGLSVFLLSNLLLVCVWHYRRLQGSEN